MLRQGKVPQRDAEGRVQDCAFLVTALQPAGLSVVEATTAELSWTFQVNMKEADLQTSTQVC